MKTLSTLTGFALAGLLYTFPNLANGQWTSVGSPGISTGSSTYQSLALGNNGIPYVAYNDQSYGSAGKAVVMKYDGSGWVNVGTPGFTADAAEQGSLATGPGDTLFFSYQDGPSGMASVMKFNGASWVQLGSAGISSGTATYTCIRVNAYGTPYLAYIDGATGNACVKMFDGTAWVNTGAAAEVSPGGANYLSLDLDAAGYPWIGFTDATNSNNATVMKFDGSSWSVVGTAGFSASLSGVIYMDLTISPDNTPYVAYANPFSGVTGNVMKFDGSAWVSVGSPDFTASSAIFNTITIATDGTPYLAFMDNSVPGSKGSVMKYDAVADTWDYLGSSGFTGTGAGYLTSLLNGNTFLYVTSSDGDYSGKTTVMQYQLCQPASFPTLASVPSVCVGDTVTLFITAGNLNDDANWQWYVGGCHDLAAGTGTNLTVVISDTITFYANGDDYCVYAGDSCASITINPYALPDVPVITGTGVLTSSATTGNQWLLNGNIVSGATNQTYTPSATGWYSVMVTNANGCSATSDSVFITITGIAGQQASTEKIYPVPFDHTLNIQLSQNNGSMSIHDPSGRIVLSSSNLQLMNSFDLSHLDSGIYYVTLTQGTDKKVYQVVKQ